MQSLVAGTLVVQMVAALLVAKLENVVTVVAVTVVVVIQIIAALIDKLTPIWFTV